MSMTPQDIQQKRFSTGFRGYDRKEVESFLALVRGEMEALLREAAELRALHQANEDRAAALTEQEASAKSAMLMTQRIIEDMKDNARKDATLVMRDAEVRGQQILNNAQQEKGRLEAEIANLRRERHHVVQDMKKMLETHLEMVRYEEGKDEGKEGTAPGR